MSKMKKAPKRNVDEQFFHRDNEIVEMEVRKIAGRQRKHECTPMKVKRWKARYQKWWKHGEMD